jgi:parvulin-like peptidyl-prolyl isomerase
MKVKQLSVMIFAAVLVVAAIVTMIFAPERGDVADTGSEGTVPFDPGDSPDPENPGGPESPDSPKNPLGVAFRVGNIEIDPVEFDYYYYLSYNQIVDYFGMYGMLEYIGLDPEQPLTEQYVQHIIPETMTWDDYLKDQAAQTLQYLVTLYAWAETTGTVLTDADEARISQQMEGAASLQAVYGQGMTPERYRDIMRRQVLALLVQADVIASFDRSDEALEAHYQQNRAAYDIIDYNMLIFNEDQRDLAEEILSRVTTSAAFEALYNEFIEEINADFGPQIHYTGPAAELHGNLGAFLADDERSPGDKAVVEDSGFLLVTLFNSRSRNEELLCNVRHILIGVDGYDSADAARARAEEILRMWKDGAADEDSFAELARLYTTDDASAASGGLYSNISPASSYVAPFLNWTVDPSRRPGDTGIVEVNDWYHGFHIMYFSGSSAAWKQAVKADMDNVELDGWLIAQFEDFPYHFLPEE